MSNQYINKNSKENWYINLYKSGYFGALKRLKNKYSHILMFDYGRKTINGEKTKEKDEHPNFLQIHHDLELNFSDLSIDYSGYYTYYENVNFSQCLTYCNIFEHYVLHCLIKTTKVVEVPEEDLFKIFRKDLSPSELKDMLKNKRIRMEQKHKNDFFAGWSGIYKQITRIYEIHYKGEYALGIYAKYMKAFSEKDYLDFTDFWYQLPNKFRKNQIKIDSFFNKKNFYRHKNESSQIGKGKNNINSLINVNKGCNYEICTGWGNKPLFSTNGTYKLVKTFCRTQKKNNLALFTNYINREMFINFFTRDEKFLEHVKKLVNQSNLLRCLLSNINNPINFIQFFREVGSMFYGYPCGNTLATNDIINFASILPILISNPKLLEKGQKTIYEYMIKNNLPIPSTWEKPKLNKELSFGWDKNIVKIDRKKIQIELGNNDFSEVGLLEFHKKINLD